MNHTDTDTDPDISNGYKKIPTPKWKVFWYRWKTGIQNVANVIWFKVKMNLLDWITRKNRAVIFNTIYFHKLKRIKLKVWTKKRYFENYQLILLILSYVDNTVSTSLSWVVPSLVYWQVGTVGDWWGLTMFDKFPESWVWSIYFGATIAVFP